MKSDRLSALSIHVGGTPVIELICPHTSKPLKILAKLEHMNPTGSHKDRESLLVVRDCMSKGFKEVGCASTGNFGFSLSYFAKQAGLNAHIWVPRNTSLARKILLKMYMPTVHEFSTDLAELVNMSDQLMEDKNIYNANPGKCLLKREANQDIISELLASFSSIQAVYACVNNGTHLLGLTQASTSMRINGVYSLDHLAASICGFSHAEGIDNIKKAVSTSSGCLLEATRLDIVTGQYIAQYNGLIIENASAATIGVAVRHKDPKAQVCCVLTGCGMKYPDEYIKA